MVKALQDNTDTKAFDKAFKPANDTNDHQNSKRRRVKSRPISKNECFHSPYLKNQTSEITPGFAICSSCIQCKTVTMWTLV